MKLRKISAIVLALVVLTVGGVYATWTFSEETAGNASTDATLVLEGVSTGTEKGTIEVVASSEIFKIDQESISSHKAVLNVAEGAYVKVSFRPSASASTVVKEEGIPVKVVFSVSNNTFKVNEDGLYDAEGTATPIFSLNAASATINIPTSAWTENAGVFEYTIDRAAIVAMINIADLTIDTKASYDLFATALTGAKLTATASEVVA